ncbi:transmembrane protein 6/97 [Fennellomyces sp. T-0311]|nr:transmembrane protein 6/97 [Fennellomyces sp. T-0311]
MVSNQPTTKSLFSRPLDLIFFGYFASHIPITICVDIQSFYPPEIVPQALKDVLAWYLETYKDPFMSASLGFSAPIPWFQGVVFCEMLLQLPFFFAACYGLWKVYASHVATTMVPILAELYNPDFGLVQSERYMLLGFYLPYLFIPLMILADSYIRISKAISTPARTKTE